MRVEIFVCLTKFDWRGVKARVGAMGASSIGVEPGFCDALMDDPFTQRSFDLWTLGRGGRGAIYQTPETTMTVHHRKGEKEQDQEGTKEIQQQVLAKDTELNTDR